MPEKSTLHDARPRWRTAGCLALVAALLGIGAACTRKPPEGYAPIPADFRQPRFPQESTAIEPGDTLNIRFYYHPELNDSMTVRPDGKISLPLHQGIAVTGKSPEQLQEELHAIYAQEFVDPAITVNIEKAVNAQVFVTGEVAQGGAKPLPGNATVSQVLATSSVLTTEADLGNVILVRQTRKDLYTAYRLDADLVAGKDRSVYMAPGDILIVPKNGITMANDFVKKYITNMIPTQANVVWGFTYYLNSDSSN